MAKDKSGKTAPQSKDKQDEYKKAHTATNKQRRIKKHELKTLDRKHGPKTPRGTARALRRYTERVSKEFPPILNSRYNPAEIHQVPVSGRRERVKVLPTVVLNGVLMTVEQAVVEARRQLAQRKAEQATTARA